MNRSLGLAAIATLTAGLASPALAGSSAEHHQALVERAGSVSRAAGRAFRSVVKLKDRELTGVSGQVGDKAHFQILASSTSRSTDGVFVSTSDSAAVTGKRLSEYHVEAQGRDGRESFRGGWWTARRDLLGGLLSVRARTVVSSKEHEGKALTRVHENRRTLHLGNVPVLWLGRAMSPADIAQVGDVQLAGAR